MSYSKCPKIDFGAFKIQGMPDTKGHRFESQQFQIATEVMLHFILKLFQASTFWNKNILKIILTPRKWLAHNIKCFGF